MKRSRISGRRVALAASFLLSLANAQAATGGGLNEFSLAATGLAFGGGGGGIGIAPGYHFPVLPWLQASAMLSYESLNYGSTSVKQVVLAFGPTFNIGPYPSATFIFPAITFRSGSGTTPLADGDSEPSGTGISFTFGKKVPLGASISWRPSFSILHGSGGGTYVITPAAVSYYF